MIVPGQLINDLNIELFFGSKHDTIDQSATNDKFVTQVHGNEIILVTDIKQITNDTKADGLVTKLPEVRLCVTTADCAPILLYDKHNKICAAVHAGWRGMAAGVIQNTIELMNGIGSDNSITNAFIGPCIRQQSYEVDNEVFKTFQSIDEYNENFFQRSKEDRFLFDLPECCKHILCKIGLNVELITDSLMDTFSHPTIFFSYRYYQKCDMKLKKNQRQVSTIRFKK